MQDRSLEGVRPSLLPPVSAIAFLVAAAVVLWIGGIDSVATPEAPARTDLGGHIVALRHLLETSLPSARLVDWAVHWFGGYPAFHFYFPLPALLIAAIAQLTPLEVAAKAIAVATPLLLLLGVARLARALGYGTLHVVMAQLGCLVFLSDTSHSLYGGNVISNVLGEYSYGLGLGFAVLYLSFVADHVRTGRRSMVALIVTLGAAALCHSIPTVMAVAASTVALVRPGLRARIVLSWILGFTLTAFWALPFLVRSSYMGHSVWRYAPALSAVFSPALLLLLPWTLYGLLRDSSPARAAHWLVPAMGLAGLALYLAPHSLFLQERGLPFWYLSVITLAALGLASALQARLRAGRPIERAFLIGGVSVLVAAVVIQGALVRGRALELLSAEAPDRQPYDALVATLRELPPGRLHWEDRPAKPALLGDVIALLRIPDLAPGISTTLGLLVESTHLLRPLAFVGRDISWDPAVMAADPARAGPMAPDPRPEARVARLAELGVNYLVTLSEAGHSFAGREAGLPLLRHHADWRIWEIPAAPLVEPVAMPVAAISRAQYHEAVTEWIYRGALTKERAVVVDRELEAPKAGGGEVGAVSRRARTVRFQTSAVGVPHLVRVPFFPNWRARGAEGPWLVAPGFMLVVPQQPAVELRFADTWVEHTGRALSLLTLLALPVLLLAGSRAERRRSDVQAGIPGTAADSPAA